jgi:hypothetical protein
MTTTHPARWNSRWTGLILIYLTVIPLMILLIVVFVSAIFFPEREGVVKYEDCREIVTTKPDAFDTLFHQFTCSTQKTLSGKVMRGTCVRVETTSDGKCLAAYVYQKATEGRCPVAQPFFGADDKCYEDASSGGVYAPVTAQK